MQALLPRIGLILRDASGSTSEVVMRVQAGSTFEDAAAAATALAAVVLPLSGCIEVRRRIVYSFKPEEPTPAASGSSIKRCGVFIFDTTDADHQALVQVPAILDSVLVTTEPGAGVLIDTDNADIAALIAELLSIPVTDPFANDITELVAAYRQSRV